MESRRKNSKLNSEREQPTGPSGWAFGRIDNGYITLAAAQGLDFQKRGDNAYRELRSPGTPNIWLCQVGRAAVDGNFNRFIKKVLALPVKFEGTQVELTTLRGDQLGFGWQGPLLVNGTAHPSAALNTTTILTALASWARRRWKFGMGWMPSDCILRKTRRKNPTHTPDPQPSKSYFPGLHNSNNIN